MKSSLVLKRVRPKARQFSTPTPGSRHSLRERVVLRAWKRAAARRGMAWLGDVLSPCAATAPQPCAVGSEDREGAMLLGTGACLAEQLEGIDSGFVKDMLVRRAACAMAQLHRDGGYLGHARAEHMEIMGNDVGFADLACEACDTLPLTTAQARDWMCFTSSVASHFEVRPNDLAAILFRAMRTLSPTLLAELRGTVDQLAVLEHPWWRWCGPRIRAMRIAVLAIRTGFAWLSAPPKTIHALPLGRRAQHALLRHRELP